MPTVTIIAGADASGKSTLISSLYQSGFFDTEECIGPDLIIWKEFRHLYTYDQFSHFQRDSLLSHESLIPYEDWRDASIWSKENYLKAFAIADERRNRLIAEGKDFVMETVLSTDSKMELLARLKEKGYFIRVIYVGVEEDETNAAYLIRRIRDQGHDVPMNRLLKRKQSSLQKLYEISRSMDQTILIDNSIPGTAPCVLAVYKPGYHPLRLDDGRKMPHWSKYADFLFDREEEIDFTDVMATEAKPIIDDLSRAIQLFFIHTVKMYSYNATNAFIGEKLNEDENRTMLVYSTNAGIFDGYGNRPGDLQFSNVARWYGYYRDDTFRTSLIAGWELKEKMLTVYTLNSTYVFEILKGRLDTSKIELASEEIVAEVKRRNTIKHSAYWCQVDAPEPLSRAMSVTQMPYPMNKQEAIEYVSSKLVISTDGYPATIVLAPSVSVCK